ncbi:MAG: glycoside hydrolase family 99-like domain-containing protein [Armatimonadota bacterium]
MSTEIVSPAICIRDFTPVKPLNRVGQPTVMRALIANTSALPADVQVRLVLPAGVQMVQDTENPHLRIASGCEIAITWTVQADAAMPCRLDLVVAGAGSDPTTASTLMCFLPAIQVEPLSYIPEPKPATSRILIGAHHCPLWEADKPAMWDNVLKHPERTPALGFYAQENPEVSDWETLWAAEHGIDFFVYCWYRTSQGGPVTTMFSSAIHEALFKSRYADKMHFTIMWENQSRGKAGIADEQDLMENLLPFWIEHYFTHPSYLKIDGKPVLYIYRPEFLIDDLGSIENVARAIALMRQACKDAGFEGLYVLGENRNVDAHQLSLMKEMGLDYTFAYCWYVANDPTPTEAISAQLDYMHGIQQLGILPQIPTASQAWSGWHDEGTIWKIPPAEFETLLREVADFMATLPPQELGSRMLLLDNWNEWGEGHYLAPYQEYGFGYLDAVRNVFTDAPASHLDLIPEDIGMGPYDTAIRALMEQKKTGE